MMLSPERYTVGPCTIIGNHWRFAFTGDPIMLTIINPTTNRQTDYSKSYLAREARYYVKHEPDSDGKLRAWGIVVVLDQVILRADYLTKDGIAKSANIAL